MLAPDEFLWGCLNTRENRLLSVSRFRVFRGFLHFFNHN